MTFSPLSISKFTSATLSMGVVLLSDLRLLLVVCCLLEALPFIPASLRPVLNRIPTRLHRRVALHCLFEINFELCELQQFRQIVRVAVVDQFLVREIMFPCSFGNAGFQGALDRVSRKI